MDPRDTPEEARFRQELRQWLEVVIPTLPWPEPADLLQRLPFWRAWNDKLLAGGYAGLSWPSEYGGRDAGVMLQAIFNEELDRAGAPENLNTVGEKFAGPTLIEFGNEDQKQRLVPKILTGEHIWCQLFSEPDAGSDLASLRTKAERVTGGWKVSGQKVWSSRAQVATFGMLLARTGGGPRHRGITYFLLPMDTEGVHVAPLPQMLGSTEFNEVFLDDVFVPDDLILGEVDGGWALAMATLGFERTAIATGRVNTRRVMDDILQLIRGMRDGDGRPLGLDPLVRDKAADLYGRVVMQHLTAQRALTEMEAGKAPGAESSVWKLLSTKLVEDLADFALSLHGLDGQQADPAADRIDEWIRLAYQARGTSIAGGTTFIQRNIVAQRILGLPRDHR